MNERESRTLTESALQGWVFLGFLFDLCFGHPTLTFISNGKLAFLTFLVVAQQRREKMGPLRQTVMKREVEEGRGYACRLNNVCVWMKRNMYTPGERHRHRTMETQQGWEDE